MFVGFLVVIWDFGFLVVKIVVVVVVVVILAQLGRNWAVLTSKATSRCGTRRVEVSEVNGNRV